MLGVYLGRIWSVRVSVFEAKYLGNDGRQDVSYYRPIGSHKKVGRQNRLVRSRDPMTSRQ